MDMREFKLIMVVMTVLMLAACGGSDDAGVPAAPSDLSVALSVTGGIPDSTTALVSFTAPASDGGSAVTGYTVTANPGGISATGTSSPITLSGLTPQTAYTYSVVATNQVGQSPAAVSGALNFYRIVETFYEPMTQPNDSIFTGTFTFDATHNAVSNLKGSLTQSMTKVDPTCVSTMTNPCAYGSPMTEVALANQLSAAAVTLDGEAGFLVTTFALNTTDTFDGGGFAPGGTEYFGLSEGATNPKSGGIGNAYAMIFVNTTDPTLTVTQAQIDKLAYADCTAGGMMMSTCMTGTTLVGYGRTGTMNGQPLSQVITLE
jgi:hypothetical protein